MFYADLHVHSKFSRATSGDCDLEHLALWAGRKGVRVVGTGDCTHGGWLAEIQAKLIPAEPGLLRLRPELEQALSRGATRAPAPWDEVPQVRFVLQVELATIYKKAGRTRKVHHLAYVPDLPSATRLRQRLLRIGNLDSDGRPILGLDSRDLLEIVLGAGPGAFLIPAHIWTPWFAVLGSMSGFDTIEECYADLSDEVFALETGLSSDPPMNWRLSSLDRFTLVSSSDAHSPAKLGREACVFDTALDYFAMRRALQTGVGYLGTVEFFPEEGKYHYDGHRQCRVCWAPEQTRRHAGRCPVCAKPVTLGVMHRVSALADRVAPPDPLPPRAAAVRSLIPLAEVLAEIHGVGPQTHTVQTHYDQLLERLGPELFILHTVPLEDIRRAGSELLAEAIRRMRQGRVMRQPGFDGQYGVIRLFGPDELLRRGRSGWLVACAKETQGLEPDRPLAADAQTELPAIPAAQPQANEHAPRQDDAGVLAPCGTDGGEPAQATPNHDWVGPRTVSELAATCLEPAHLLDALDPHQRAAAQAADGPVLIVAGPGTGKTHTLTHRLAYLIAARGVAPEQCLTLAFSRRAAGELIQRLERLLPGVGQRVPVLTFHRLGLVIVREHWDRLGLAPQVRVASLAERCQLLEEVASVSKSRATALLERLSVRKRRLADDLAEVPSLQSAEHEALQRYHQALRARGWVDFDDLLVLPLHLLDTHPDLLAHYRARYGWVSVDEYQDIDAAQYGLVRRLVPPGGNVCAIGDPDQAIYGFRGADVGFFQRFCDDFPTARVFRLERNYRSTPTIVGAALELIAPASLVAGRRLEAEASGPEQIEVHPCATDRAEAELVVHSIDRMMGGSTFFSLDSQRASGHEAAGLSFADFAVLYRTEQQAEVLVEAFARSGIPVQRRSHHGLADQPCLQAVLKQLADAVHGSARAGPLPALLAQSIRTVVPDPAEAALLAAALEPLAVRHAHDPTAFWSELALGVDVDLWDSRADRVALLTLHAAKGLEFSVVFIVGCEDGLLPLRFGPLTPEALAEERRLLFVGMTRARRLLVLTHATKRLWRGAIRTMAPSPFLADIQRQWLAVREHRAARKKAAAPDPQRTLFEC